MSQITARFIQGPDEVRRYLLDYTLDLNTGESLSSIAVTISSPTDQPPTLVVNNIVLAPAVNGQVTQATFFVSVGLSGASYELDFLATTSLSQVIETVVAINVVNKT
jgi:hypothetical protein